ncbi:MAG: sugar phosphate isomerase/epimerase [Chloroflexi bacterium]|nr:sugar phosphate isomerase/epimerase [Chloroflexota bacterium]
MLPIGIHLSYWQVKWDDDLLPLIQKAKSAGFDVAEFPLLFPGELNYEDLRAELNNLGILASCGTGLGPGTDITHQDSAVRTDGLAHLRACLEGAAKLGSPGLGGVTYAPWGFFPEDDWGDRLKRCVASLKEAVKIAEDYNVLLHMELLNRFEGYLINTVEQGLNIIDQVDSNYLKLHLDTFHLNIEADQIGAEIQKAGRHLGHFHLVANNRKIPGAGHIPWHEVRTALKAINYSGYLVAETFVNPAGEVGKGLYIWRQLAADLDAAAKNAADFIKQEMADV